MIDIVSEINKNLAVGTVTEYSQIAAELEKLRSDFGAVVPDCSTRDGYEFSKNAALTCRDIRTNLENVRKEKKQPYLDYSRLIDSQAKEIKESLEAIENPHKDAYQAVDARKKAELEARKQLIADMNNIRIWATDKSENEISEKIEDIQNLDVSKEAFGRLIDDAMAAQATAIEALYACHASAVNARIEADRLEQERIELEALRAEKAARDQAEQDRLAEQQQIERDQRIKDQAAKEAAEQAELAAKAALDREQQAIIDAQQAEQRRLDQEAAAQQAAIDAENRRIADVEAAKQAEIDRQNKAAADLAAEQAALEANKTHKSNVKRLMLGAMILGGMDESQARIAINLIAGNKVPNVKITY